MKVVEDLVAIVCAPKKYYTNSKWTKEFIVEFQQKLEKRLAELSKKELQAVRQEMKKRIYKFRNEGK